MQRKTTTWRLAELHQKRQKGQIDDNVPFQRRHVWRPKTKKLLIDSVWKDIGIPELTFWKEEKDGRIVYHTIDGKQRGSTISEFFNNALTFRLDARYLAYKDLKETQQDRFDDYEIAVTIYSDCSLVEATEFFQRTNAGVPLNATEKRHGVFGPIRNLCYLLSMSRTVDGEEIDHETLFDVVPFNGIRGDHEKIIAQCFVLESALDDIQRGKYPDIKTGDLNRLYNHQDAYEEKVFEGVKDKMALLTKLFGDEQNGQSLAKAIFIDTYAYFLSRGKPKSTGEKEKLVLFVKWLSQNRSSPTLKAGDFDYAYYSSKQADSGSSIKARQTIFAKALDKFKP